MDKNFFLLSFSLSLSLTPASGTSSPKIHATLPVQDTVATILHRQRVRPGRLVSRLRLPNQSIRRIQRHQIPILLQDQPDSRVGLARARGEIDRPQISVSHVEHQSAIRLQDKPESPVFGVQLFHLDAAVFDAHRGRVL